MRDKIGIREESAGMGIMVGGTFNHDGTALYEAMAALFVSQALGMHWGWAIRWSWCSCRSSPASAPPAFPRRGW